MSTVGRLSFDSRVQDRVKARSLPRRSISSPALRSGSPKCVSLRRSNSSPLLPLISARVRCDGAALGGASLATQTSQSKVAAGELIHLPPALLSDIYDEDDSFSETTPFLPSKQRVPKAKEKVKTVHSGKEAGNVSTFITLVKSFVGVGVLFLPRGFYNGGVAFSAAVLCVVALVSYYCMMCLIRCSLKIRGGTFGDIGFRAVGSSGQAAVNIALVFSQMGFCCSYLIFIAKHVQTLLVPNLPMWALILMQVPLVSPLVWVRRVSRLGPASLLGTFAVVVGITYIYFHALHQLSLAGAAEVKAFNGSSFPLFLGTACYTFEGIGLVIPIRNSMENKKAFKPILVGALSFIVALFVSFGAVCYLAFGSSVEAPVTLNLDDTYDNDDPSDDVGAGEGMVGSIQLLYSFACLCTFPLMMFPVVNLLESALGFPTFSGSGDIPLSHKMRKNVFRTFVCVVTAAVAIVGSGSFDNFIALIGGVCCVPLAFIFPAWFHFTLVSKGSPWMYVDVVVAVFGIAIMIFASYEAIAQW
eukprot:Rmarinus@m.3485